jgi:hypothetical protein
MRMRSPLLLSISPLLQPYENEPRAVLDCSPVGFLSKTAVGDFRAMLGYPCGREVTWS